MRGIEEFTPCDSSCLFARKTFWLNGMAEASCTRGWELFPPLGGVPIVRLEFESLPEDADDVPEEIKLKLEDALTKRSCIAPERSRFPV